MERLELIKFLHLLVFNVSFFLFTFRCCRFTLNHQPIGRLFCTHKKIPYVMSMLAHARAHTHTHALLIPNQIEMQIETNQTPAHTAHNLKIINHFQLQNQLFSMEFHSISTISIRSMCLSLLIYDSMQRWRKMNEQKNTTTTTTASAAFTSSQIIYTLSIESKPIASTTALCRCRVKKTK